MPLASQGASETLRLALAGQRDASLCARKIRLPGPASIPEPDLYSLFCASAEFAYFGSIGSCAGNDMDGVDALQLRECARWLQMPSLMQHCDEVLERRVRESSRRFLLAGLAAAHPTKLDPGHGEGPPAAPAPAAAEAQRQHLGLLREVLPGAFAQAAEEGEALAGLQDACAAGLLLLSDAGTAAPCRGDHHRASEGAGGLSTGHALPRLALGCEEEAQAPLLDAASRRECLGAMQRKLVDWAKHIQQQMARGRTPAKPSVARAGGGGAGWA